MCTVHADRYVWFILIAIGYSITVYPIIAEYNIIHIYTFVEANHRIYSLVSLQPW